MKSTNISKPQTDKNAHLQDKKLQEIEAWIRVMNYRLLLQHTHSDEYYKRN